MATEKPPIAQVAPGTFRTNPPRSAQQVIDLLGHAVGKRLAREREQHDQQYKHRSQEAHGGTLAVRATRRQRRAARPAGAARFDFCTPRP